MRGKVKCSAMTGCFDKNTRKPFGFRGNQCKSRVDPDEPCLTFFHPDYTVGPGISPDRALQKPPLVRDNLSRSWALPPVGTYAVGVHPAPKVILFSWRNYNFSR